MRLLVCATALVPLIAGNLFAPPEQRPVGPFEPAVSAWVAPGAAAGSVAADTLRTSAEPDTPLIMALPANVNQRFVERYSLLRGPALSGVAGRSFMWIPRGSEPGSHEVLLRAHYQSEPPDTLFIQIDLQP